MSAYPILDVRSIPSLVSSVDRHSFIANISPFIATEIIKKYNYERQRPLTKSKVRQLSSAMNDGTFEPISTIIFSVESEISRLVDGQHTLHAIIDSNTSWSLPVIVSKKSADTMYPKIDRNKSRSLKDFVRSSKLSSDLGLSETFSLSVARGVKVILNNYSAHSSNRKSFVSEDQLLIVTKKEYKESASRVCDIVTGLEYGKKLVSRIPMAVLLTLYKELPINQHLKIDEFVYGCATNVNLGLGDVRRMIYGMYANYSRTGGAVVTGKLSITASYEISLLLTCWKYWFENKTHQSAFSARQINNTLQKEPNLAGTDIHFSVKQQ